MKIPPPFRIPHAVALIFIGLYASSKTEASVILSDQILTGAAPAFYVTGSNIHNQNPTSGTGWGATGWAGDSTSSQTVSATNLAMAGVTNDGGSIRLSSPGTSLTREANRAFAPSSNQTTLWFGTIIDPTAGNATSQLMEGFMSGALTSASTWTNTALQGFSWGLVNNSKLTVQYQSNAANASTAGTLNTVSSSASFTLGTNYLLIAELTIDPLGNDDLEVWFKATIPASQSALGTPDISITNADIVTNSSVLNTVNLWVSNGAGSSDTANIDYMNVGTTFNDIVAAVPEPNTVALFGSAIIVCGLVIRSRHRAAAGMV